MGLVPILFAGIGKRGKGHACTKARRVVFYQADLHGPACRRQRQQHEWTGIARQAGRHDGMFQDEMSRSEHQHHRGYHATVRENRLPPPLTAGPALERSVNSVGRYLTSAAQKLLIWIGPA